MGILQAESVLREIREQGYAGGIPVLRELMHPLRPVVAAAATVRWETAPGEQAQIHFGAFPYGDRHGQRRTVWGFAMVLAYSRMLYNLRVKGFGSVPHWRDGDRNGPFRGLDGGRPVAIPRAARPMGAIALRGPTPQDIGHCLFPECLHQTLSPSPQEFTRHIRGTGHEPFR